MQNSNSFKANNQDLLFAELILPVAIMGTFTYKVPLELEETIKVGQRVEVEFGKKKHYAAIVKSLSRNTQWTQTKDILTLIDTEPLVTEKQLSFWEWLSQYYLCGLGEIMLAAIPALFRLQSETCIIKLDPPPSGFPALSDDEYMVLEALELRHELRVSEVQQLLQKTSIFRLLHSMIEKRWISAHEKMEDTVEIPHIAWIRLHEKLRTDEIKLHEALNQIQKSELQTRSIIHYLQINKDYGWIKKKELQKLSSTSSSVTDALIKKGVYEQSTFAKFEYPEEHKEARPILLSEDQIKARDFILQEWGKKSCVLLHGVTGSGKTMIYLDLMLKCIENGLQVLYLVPEIALTSQLVHRLKAHLAEHLLEYHSDLSPKAKIAVWNAAHKFTKVFIGARSSIFLPFHNLGLIIVDEEHDASYKQTDPAPRYQARDCAIILAQKFKSNILLGSASPSLESYYNSMQGKYSYIRLEQRFGDSSLPEIQTVSMKEAQQFGKLKGLFTETMLEEMRNQFAAGKQVIVFRNRRGYSPLLQCSNCLWEAGCNRCDIHMTLHKMQNKLKCHICGNQNEVPQRCPECGQYTLRILGFGTEQIEEELKIQFPDKNIQRLDLDSARSRNMQQKIIEAFQDREIDILVGTQMVTKGLDFDHVGLVGILQADQILLYPEFRAHERGYQLLTQVSGRAGRRSDLGKVLIQGYHIHHPVIQFVLQHQPENFYQSELAERKKFKYPPFYRLIRVQLLHLKIEQVEKGASLLASQLKKLFSNRVLGPSEPHLSRIKGSYVREILIKIEKNAERSVEVKSQLLQLSQQLKSTKDFKTIRVHIDVDP